MGELEALPKEHENGCSLVSRRQNNPKYSKLEEHTNGFLSGVALKQLNKGEVLLPANRRARWICPGSCPAKTLPSAKQPNTCCQCFHVLGESGHGGLIMSFTYPHHPLSPCVLANCSQDQFRATSGPQSWGAQCMLSLVELHFVGCSPLSNNHGS